MSREDLSTPPSDAVLLSHIICNVLGGYPEGTTISMSAVLADASEQCPASVSKDAIAREVIEQIRTRGLAVQFDGRS